MKKLTLVIILLVGTSVAYGQNPELDFTVGTYQGSGIIRGRMHTVKLKIDIGNIVLTYGRATRCTTILLETDYPHLYEENDITLPSGKPRKDSCSRKRFVFLVKEGDGLIFHWGDTLEITLGESWPVKLKKTSK